MIRRRLVAAAASAVLAVPPVTTAPPATGPEPSKPAVVPCPIAPLTTPVKRPPPPVPPAHDTSRPPVGGSGLATRGLTVPPGAPPVPTKLTATSWLVADLNTGAVLGACGPHEYGPPASVQKLLLATTVMGKLDPTQTVEVVRDDLNIERGSSAVGLLVGGKYRVDTLWLGLLLNSGNDAANVLARLGGGPGGVPATMAAMNAEAARLGAFETRAVTPSGLDGPGQFTSAYDLALITRECFAREDFRRYIATERAQIPPQPPRDPRGYQIQNENQLLYTYQGALGGKTGFTDLARHTYVGVAERDGRRLAVTLLGAEHQPIRAWQQGATLLDWGFSVPADAKVGKLVKPGEVKAAPPPKAGKAAGAAARAAGGGAIATGGRALPAWSPAVFGTATLVVVALPALVLVTWLRRRRPVSRRS
jgi:D-alanyl-D-alanine carboxypeptidase (penicillin-binding protein 5/6)